MMGIIDKVIVDLKYVPFFISFLFWGFIIDLDKGLQDGTARAGLPTARPYHNQHKNGKPSPHNATRLPHR